MSDAGTNQRRTIEDATCLGCACLCDDIGLVVEGDRIVEARRACGRGRGWYDQTTGLRDVGPMVSGTATTLDRALDRAAEVLSRAKAPAVAGMGTSIEAQRITAAIADRIGAFLFPLYAGPNETAAFQRLGDVSATLGEVRDRADLVVFDSPSWPERLPRFLERFVDPPGRFVPGGHAGRTVILLGRPSNRTGADDAWATRPHERVEIGRDRLAAYQALRGLVNGATLDPGAVLAATGVPLDRLAALADRLKRARYGVLIHGYGSSAKADAEAIPALVRDLNRSTRFVAIRPTLPASDPGHSVLAWQAGASGAVDFALGHPRHLPHEELMRRTCGREVDAMMLVGDVHDLTDFNLDTYAISGPVKAMAAMPKVFVGPLMIEEEGALEPRQAIPRDALKRFMDVDSFLPTAWAGIDEGGTVARFDGVMLPLRPPFPGRRPSQAEVLRAILDRLDTSKGPQP